MITLENDHIKATFLHRGAELKNLIDKETHLDYMWKADPVFWGKTSPVLFPIVGALKDDQYLYQDQVYNLPRHGFAREMDFEVADQSETAVLFILKDTPETRFHYPFAFKLGIRYSLKGSSLICRYEVYNPGNEPLLFSIGGHPAFAVPLKEKEQYGDYFLKFNADEQLDVHKIKGNLVEEETFVLSLEDSRLPLKHSLFDDDALVMKNLKSNQISLLNTKNKHGLIFRFDGFPYFGIWAAKDADFVCLEPWCGIADGAHHQGKLEDKEGIVKLLPGMKWEKLWEINII